MTLATEEQTPGAGAALLRRMKAIREPGMRSARMAELLGGDPEEVVSVVRDLIGRSGRSDPGVTAALDALGSALTSGLLAYRQRASLYAAARRRGEVVVARLLLDVSIRDGEVTRLEASLGAARPLVPRGRPLSLGERKSLARGRRSETLLHLLRDPHPQVVEILLGNPHLVESDVIAVAARRPTLPRCQELVYASDRWRSRTRVRRALALNPYTPAALSMLLVATLSDADLGAVARDVKLAQPIRQQARGVSELRREPG